MAHRFMNRPSGGPSATPRTVRCPRLGQRDISRSARTGICGCIPAREPARGIDLKELVDKLVLRGIILPILIRFADILKHRLGEIHGAFQTRHPASTAIRAATAACIPIKVNQQRQVVEEVLRVRQALPSSAWKPARSRNCWP